jgi:hypothetical protein
MLFEQIIIQLNNLGKLEQGGKICKDSRGLISLDTQSKLQPLFRFFYGESKQTTIDYISTLIESAFDIADSLMNHQHYTIYKNKKIEDISSIENKLHEQRVKDLQDLCESLELSIRGIENLKITYKEFPPIITILDRKIKIICGKVIEIKSDIENSHTKYITKNNLAAVVSSNYNSDEFGNSNDYIEDTDAIHE